MRIFKEEQRFTQTWLIILIAITILIEVAVIAHEYTKEDATMTGSELILVLVFVLIFSSIIFIFKLKTRIDEKGIHYQFIPFHLSKRTIAWTDLKLAHTRTYDAITEYGGWGMKGGFLWRKSKGVAYNVSGNIGIQLEYKSGKKILIGTQKLNDANAVLKTYQQKLKSDAE